MNKVIPTLIIIIIIIFYILNYYKNNFHNSNKHPLYDLLYVYQYDNKIRLGRKKDGGYVIADLINQNYDCYLSCGVANEESFSRDFINKYNMNENNSFAFDASINKYPTKYTNKITQIKLL